MINIRSSADVGANGIKTLIYGGFGVGKTPLCASAPSPIIISAEQGLLSIKKANPPVPYIEVRNFQDLQEVSGWMVSPSSQQFYTLCLDSLSEIVEVLLVEERRKVKDPRQAFYAVLDRAVEFARWMRDLPGRNVVLIAKEEYSKDESTGAKMFMPMMPGNKLGQELPYFFDEVFRMVKGKDANQQPYCALITREGFQHQARDRSGMLAEFEPPDLTHVFKKILGYSTQPIPFQLTTQRLALGA